MSTGSDILIPIFRLIENYCVENWWPAESRFEVLVGAVLVQNTRWMNAEKAIKRLRDRQFLDPKCLSRASTAELQNLIRPAGCQSVKARRLVKLSSWVVASGGLEALAALETPILREALLEVHGIGEETADAILCFGFARRVFIADRYARTWLARMGLVPAAATGSYAVCRQFMESSLADREISMQALHAAIVMHAQNICRQKPKCSACHLTRWCTHGSTVRG